MSMIFSMFLALSAGAFVALSMVIQRYALTNLEYQVQLLCCKVPRPAVWFIGLLIYGIANGLYAFAVMLGALSLVASLFTLLLVFNLIFARLILKEELSPTKVLGNILIIAGACLSVLGTPTDLPTVLEVEDVEELVVQPQSCAYVLLLIVAIAAATLAIIRFERMYGLTETEERTRALRKSMLLPVILSQGKNSVAYSKSPVNVWRDGMRKLKLAGHITHSSGIIELDHQGVEAAQTTTPVSTLSPTEQTYTTGQTVESTKDHAKKDAVPTDDVSSFTSERGAVHFEPVLEASSNPSVGSSLKATSPAPSPPPSPPQPNSNDAVEAASQAPARSSTSPLHRKSFAAIPAKINRKRKKPRPPKWLNAVMSVVYPASLGLLEGVSHLTMKAVMSMIAECFADKWPRECITSWVVYAFPLVFVVASLSTVYWLKIVFTRFETTTALPIEYGTVNACSVLSGLVFYSESKYMSTTQLSLACSGLVVVFVGVALSTMQKLPFCGKSCDKSSSSAKVSASECSSTNASATEYSSTATISEDNVNSTSSQLSSK